MVFYVFFVALLVVGAAGAVALAVGKGKAAAQPWSSWKPADGSTQTEMAEIAAHIGKGYELNKAHDQLVGIIPGSPELTQYTTIASISTICTLRASTHRTAAGSRRRPVTCRRSSAASARSARSSAGTRLRHVSASSAARRWSSRSTRSSTSRPSTG